jgi:hypothetical protein
MQATNFFLELLPQAPSSGRSRKFLGAVEEVSEFARTYIVNTDNFVDPLEDPPAAIGSEAAAAAAALAVAAGRPNGPGAGIASAAGAAPPAAAVKAAMLAGFRKIKDTLTI